MDRRTEQFLAAIGPVAARDAVRSLLAPRTFARGSWLLQAGERARDCFFIVRGLVRELYIDDDGTEHTRTFMAEGEITGSLLDLLSNEASVTWIQALEDTAVMQWRWRDLERLCIEHPSLHVVLRRSAERLYVKKARREHEMLALTAHQRYARWLADNPALDARVSRRDLASYLGITPEHLSRVRRAHRPSRAP